MNGRWRQREGRVMVHCGDGGCALAFCGRCLQVTHGRLLQLRPPGLGIGATRRVALQLNPYLSYFGFGLVVTPQTAVKCLLKVFC